MLDHFPDLKLLETIMRKDVTGRDQSGQRKSVDTEAIVKEVVDKTKPDIINIELLHMDEEYAFIHYDRNGFPSQLTTLLAKFPELSDIKLFDQLIEERVSKINNIGQKSGVLNHVQKFNSLLQVTIAANTISNIDDRGRSEQYMRDEWEKLIIPHTPNTFQRAFPELIKKAKLKGINPYNNQANLDEIHKFSVYLQYYTLSLYSHLSKERGSFAHLIPLNTLQNVTVSSLDNFFNMVLGKDDVKTIETIFTTFNRIFPIINKFNWNYVVEKELPSYNKSTAYKIHTQLLVDTFRPTRGTILAEELENTGNKEGVNNFIINTENEDLFKCNE